MSDEEEKLDDMDEGATEAASAPASGSLSKIIKILLYVVGAVVLILLVIGISYLVSKHVQEKQYQQDQDVVVAPAPAPLASYDLPAFSATTSDPEPRFLKMTIAVAYDFNSELSSEITQRVPQMQHIINIILGSKGFDDLDSESDKIMLCEEIKAHINSTLISGKIKEIYLKEYILN